MRKRRIEKIGWYDRRCDGCDRRIRAGDTYWGIPRYEHPRYCVKCHKEKERERQANG